MPYFNRTWSKKIFRIGIWSIVAFSAGWFSYGTFAHKLPFSVRSLIKQTDSGSQPKSGKQGTEPATHLNRYYHFTHLMRTPVLNAELSRYRSVVDTTLQSVLALKPHDRPIRNLIFFFHGMDGDCGDVVAVQDLAEIADALIICPGGRGPAWVSDKFLADAEQVIRAYAGTDSRFQLAGVSMGGTQALVLAGLLPDDLKRRIQGVLAFIPGADLYAVVQKTSQGKISETMRASVKNDLEILSKRSPVNLIEKYPAGLPFVIFRNSEDTLLPPEDLDLFIRRLRESHPVAVMTVPGDHAFVYSNFDFKSFYKMLGTSEDLN